MKSANDFAIDNNIFDVICVSQRGIVRRSDAFIFIKGREVVLLDAGLPEVPYALAKLLELRASFLTGNKDLLEDKSVKLEITWIASHMHIDHIGAFLDSIASSPYISVKEAYLPPRTVYYDEELSPLGDGDFKYRDRLDDIFQNHQAQCRIENIPFTSTETFSFEKSGVAFTLLPPTNDWGSPEYVSYCKELYARTNAVSLPISIGNANSMWLIAKYKGKRFLFTGDSMKKTDRDDENLDVMLSTWKREIGAIDVLKYPHHGMERDKAAKAVIQLKPRFVICNAIDATAPDAIREANPDAWKRISFAMTGYHDVVFSVDGDGSLSLLQKAF